MNLEEYTDQQERLNRLEAMEKNARWLIENWESEDSSELCKRLGLIQGDVNWLTQHATDTDSQPEDSS